MTSLQWQANTARHVLSTREYSIAWYRSAEWISWPAYNDRQTLPACAINQRVFYCLVSISWMNLMISLQWQAKHCPSCAINQRVFYCLVSISWMNLITSLQWQANTACMCYQPESILLLGINQLHESHDQPTMTGKHCLHVLSTREYSIAWYQSAEWISLPACNDRQTLPVMCYQPESILLLGINQLNESHYQPTMTGKHCLHVLSTREYSIAWYQSAEWISWPAYNDRQTLPACAINQRVFYCLVSISWMNLIPSLQWQANTARHVLSTREYSIAWYQSAEWISWPAYNERQTLPVMCYQPKSILLLGINQLNESHDQPTMTGKHCLHVLSTREYSIAWYQSAEWISWPACNDRQTLPVMCYQPESILLLGINQLNESHYQPTMTGKHCLHVLSTREYSIALEPFTVLTIFPPWLFIDDEELKKIHKTKPPKQEASGTDKQNDSSRRNSKKAAAQRKKTIKRKMSRRSTVYTRWGATQCQTSNKSHTSLVYKGNGKLNYYGRVFYLPKRHYFKLCRFPVTYLIWPKSSHYTSKLTKTNTGEFHTLWYNFGI